MSDSSKGSVVSSTDKDIVIKVENASKNLVSRLKEQ